MAAEDVGDLEAKLRVVLDENFRQQLAANLTREFAALATTLKRSIGRAVGGALGSAFKDAGGQMRGLGDKNIVEPLERVLAGTSLSAPLVRQANEIHTVVQKIIVDFTQLANAVKDRTAATREYLAGIQQAQLNRVNVAAQVEAERRGTKILATSLSERVTRSRSAAQAQAESERRVTLGLREESSKRLIAARSEASQRVELTRRANAEARAADQRQTALLRDSIAQRMQVIKRATVAANQAEVRATSSSRADDRLRVLNGETENRARLVAARLAAKIESDASRERVAIAIEEERRKTIARRESANTARELQRRITIDAKRDADVAVVEARRENDRLKAVAKERLADQELLNSRIRIREQAAQQRSLARSQQFYKLVSDGARRAGNVALGVGGTIAGRLLPLERRANDERVDSYERASNRILATERAGADRQVGAIRSLFARRAAEESAGYRRSEVLATEAQARFQRGVLGTATGQGALSGVLPVAAGVGVGAGLVKGLDAANDFTTALAVLREASGATAEQMARASRVAIELGNDVKLPGVSASDAANAMRILATSGVDVEQSLDGVAKAVLQLSRATKVDAEEAARAEAAAVNVFRLTGKEALKAADGLALAKIQSGASLAELSDALQQSSLQFNATFRGVTSGIDNFAQLNASLAVFAKNGLRGSDAGTSLKTALQALVGRSKDSKRELENVARNAGVTGTVLFDAEGRTRKFNEALYILKAGLSGLSDEARASTIQKIFGSDASRAATLLIDNAEAISKVTAATIKGGTAARLAAAENAGWRGGLDALTSTLETLAIKGLGGSIQRGIRATLVGFSDLLTKLADGKGVWATARAGLAGIGVALGSIVAAKAAVEVLGLLRVGLSSLRSPLGVASLALAGLGGALGVLLAKSPEARDSLSRLRKAASDFASGVGDRLSGVFSSIASGAAGLGERILPVLQDALGAVADFAERNLGPALSRVGGFLTGLADRAQQNTTATVTAMLRSLGFEHVEVRYQVWSVGPSVAPVPVPSAGADAGA